VKGHFGLCFHPQEQSSVGFVAAKEVHHGIEKLRGRSVLQVEDAIVELLHTGGVANGPAAEMDCGRLSLLKDCRARARARRAEWVVHDRVHSPPSSQLLAMTHSSPVM
jgi:hypothetical protein